MAMAFSGPLGLSGWLNRRIARPAFQDWVARMPLLNRIAKRDGAEIFDLVQGFVRSQVLFALVSLDLPRRLMNEPASAESLALSGGMDCRKMAILLDAGVAIGILKRTRQGRYGLSRQGAALTGVPGLEQMVLHHGAFYRDMGDPIALLRGETKTELAEFWPYVFGASGPVDPEVTRTYSNLMAESQRLVARDTLRTVSLSGVKRLIDIGGGSGAFLIEVAKKYPEMALDLFDLPGVVQAARERVGRAGLGDRIAMHDGSFVDDPLPGGADAVTVVRVLYDHDDATVSALLTKIFDTLPPGGRLIVSEPMSGGARPDPVTDVYFAFYTLAMRTGRTRSADEIGALCRSAGFTEIRAHASQRSYVTSVLTARKPG